MKNLGIWWMCLAWLAVGCGELSLISPASDGAGLDGSLVDGARDAARGDGGSDAGPVPQLDGGVPTMLPALPTLTNVSAAENDDSVAITFDPFDGAVDYRVYPLPRDEDLEIGADGRVVIRDAIYRCSGYREASAITVDDAPMVASGYMSSHVDGARVDGYTRSLDEATLGYVYATPGPGRVPVYALGDSFHLMDDCCYDMRWTASRVKTYTASETERAVLLARRFRDDGIVFYVPATASAATRTIYTDTDGQTGGDWTSGELFDGVYRARYYFPEGPEADAHPARQAAFQVLRDAADGAIPLMRVFYANTGGAEHDELVAGMDRFARVRYQGDHHAFLGLSWQNLSAETTLVVEALDEGCPFQGHLSSVSRPAQDVTFGTEVLHYPRHVTMQELHDESPTGEVFVNGQHDPSSRPHAIARSFIVVRPRPHAAMDFFASFHDGDPVETFTEHECVNPVGSSGNPCYASVRLESPTWSIAGDGLHQRQLAIAPILGELVVNYSDADADTGAGIRLTPHQHGTIASGSYLHATMEVDTFSTRRRYPQILISDVEPPIDWNMPEGRTLVIQTFDNWPSAYQLEVCDHRVWAQNNQCPAYDFHVVQAAGHEELGAGAEPSERAGTVHRSRFDVYASPERAYLFLDGQPYGCAELPAGRVPSGAVTVTFGDVLYHSSVDALYSTFHASYMNIVTRRHFDNLGFSSGVAAPEWDENRFPCQPPIDPGGP